MDKERFKYVCECISRSGYIHDADVQTATELAQFDPELSRRLLININLRREICDYVRARTGDKS